MPARRYARLASVAAFAVAALVVLALAPAVSLASFHAVGGSLNIDATKDAGATSVASVGGVPYVAWQETDGTCQGSAKFPRCDH